eukprot:3166290-Rhodomonas_salina.1
MGGGGAREQGQRVLCHHTARTRMSASGLLRFAESFRLHGTRIHVRTASMLAPSHPHKHVSKCFAAYQASVHSGTIATACMH